jgi:hypothetical protein
MNGNDNLSSPVVICLHLHANKDYTQRMLLFILSEPKNNIVKRIEQWLLCGSGSEDISFDS